MLYLFYLHIFLPFIPTRGQDLEEVFCEDIDPLSSAKSSKKVTTQAPRAASWRVSSKSVKFGSVVRWSLESGWWIFEGLLSN